MLAILTKGSIIILTLVTLLWFYSIYIKNVSIVDIFWGLGFVILNTYYLLAVDSFTNRQILVLILVSLWGIRLSGYLACRNIGKPEDYRYQQFRQDYGPERYWWFSYFQVFLLQGGLILIVSLPLLAININQSAINWLDYIAVLVWSLGFVFEAGGDYQLAQFKKNPKNKGKVLRSGFWKYTRHPNYFGDATVWVAYALFCIASGSYWQIMGTIIMILLIVKVSGVAMLERTLKDTKPAYREYIKKTHSFIPWFPKK
jgi:steroid 5-alpha reductase family enzyme